jgi:hypothetical protein
MQANNLTTKSTPQPGLTATATPYHVSTLYGNERLLAAAAVRRAMEHGKKKDSRSELTRYIEDELATSPDGGEVNILAWWKVNYCSYIALIFLVLT